MSNNDVPSILIAPVLHTALCLLPRRRNRFVLRWTMVSVKCGVWQDRSSTDKSRNTNSENTGDGCFMARVLGVNNQLVVVESYEADRKCRGK